MIDLKIIKDVLEYSKYNNESVFDSVIAISENKDIDVMDIVKALDETTMRIIRQECINERRVLSKSLINDEIIEDDNTKLKTGKRSLLELF